MTYNWHFQVQYNYFLQNSNKLWPPKVQHNVFFICFSLFFIEHANYLVDFDQLRSLWTWLLFFFISRHFLDYFVNHIKLITNKLNLEKLIFTHAFTKISSFVWYHKLKTLTKLWFLKFYTAPCTVYTCLSVCVRGDAAPPPHRIYALAHPWQ